MAGKEDMITKIVFKKSTISLALLVALVLPAALLIFSSCTDTLDGEVTGNIKPVVYFVNIPPEGQEFSRNPMIYWYGSDEDGQIDYFRYHIATVEEITVTLGGPIDPEVPWVETYIAALTSDDWVYLDVDPTAADPRTSSIVQMSADLNDPVNTSVLQYVFIQAFDTEGAASDIASRLFSRIDNPPQTVMWGIALDSPFVNAETAGGVITGVKVSWYGTDPIDYPSDPPPFEYEWKLFGPYTADEFYGADSVGAPPGLDSLYITQVYVTSDAQLFNLGDTVVRCDTFFLGETQTIECDTVFVTDSTETNAFGGLEPYFRTEILTEDLYRVADSSGDGVNPWVSDVADTIFDVYGRYFESSPIDTTIEMYYLFQVRSRDDAGVADLAPAFRTFTVINPAHEREICVVDYTFAGSRRYTVIYDNDVAKAYWYNQIKTWADSRTDLDIPTGLDLFDTTQINDIGGSPFRRQSKDYFRPGYVLPRLVELLKHKVVIIYADDVKHQDFHTKSGAVYTAIDAGVNVWVTARCLLIGGTGTVDCSSFNNGVPADFTRYFGVVGQAYSGWVGNMRNTLCDYYSNNPADFIGAYSMDQTQWPDVSIDTARLHSLHRWADETSTSWHRWRPELPVMPEVNWSSRAFGTEVMYLYASIYGSSHPIGSEFIFDGSPVAHRYVTTQFKTVHFNFTTPSLGTDSADVLINSVINWLYPIDAPEGVSVVDRYKDARVKISLEDAQANFVRRRIEQIDLMELMEERQQLR